MLLLASSVLEQNLIFSSTNHGEQSATLLGGEIMYYLNRKDKTTAKAIVCGQQL